MYSLVLFAAMLLGIIGMTAVFIVLTRATGSATDTAMLGAGLACLVLAGSLLLRFASPAAFALLVAEEGFAWRTLFGWHAMHWDDIHVVLVRPHMSSGAREVFMKAGEARLHFGWSDAGDPIWVSALESLPASKAKSLLHTIVNHAQLEQHEAGVWVRRDH